MNPMLKWMICKDVQASSVSLALYLAMVVWVELALAHLWVTRLGFTLQAATALFGIWILLIRCREDSPNQWDTRWIATRPLYPAAIFTGKALYFFLFLLFPLLLTRLLLSLFMGFGLANGLQLGLNATLLPLWPGLLVLSFQGYRLGNTRFFSAVIYTLTLAFLAGIRSQTFPTPGSFSFHPVLETDPDPTPAELIDPWIRVDMPADRLLRESTMETTFRHSDETYRLQSNLQDIYSHADEGRWYWHFVRRYSERRILSPAQLFPMSASTQKETRVHREGRPQTVFVNSALPETIAGSVQNLPVQLTYSTLRVQPVWHGRFVKETQLHRSVRGRVELPEGGLVALHLLGPVTQGLAGSTATSNWFGDGHGVVTVESSPESDLLVLPARIQQTTAGFPAFSRRYTLRFDDPRPFFPENTPLTLTVYSGTPAETGRRREELSLWMRAPRAEITRQLVRRVPAHEIPAAKGSRAAQPLPMAPGRFAARVDRVLNWEDIQTLSDPRVTVSHETRARLQTLRDAFNPDDPEDVEDLLDRLAWHPYLLDFLHAETFLLGVERLRHLLANPPVTNPIGLLAEWDKLQQEPTEEEQAGIAWCLVHPHGLFPQVHWRREWRVADRPPLHHFESLPVELREKTRERARERIATEVQFAQRPSLIRE